MRGVRAKSYMYKSEVKKVDRCVDCNRVLSKNGRTNKSGICSKCGDIRRTKIKNKEKMKTKIQLMWEVYREQEELFRKAIPEIVNGIDTEELFKAIRGSEYRRGKEDKEKEMNKRTIEKVNIKWWKDDVE